MGLSAGERLWQRLSDSGLALVCVRGPRCGWADPLSAGDEAVPELTWLTREAKEIAEQYRRDNADSGTPMS
ncbi:hypothetical protein FXW78_48795 [Rhodococcus opacus]|nr:hypothetical protein [Rhodococcus opacus]RZL75215.1 MAG: hypothetical protein EOP32_31960 [Rhodococcus sp. (in: high G+C Gram-positive bacteria)]